MGDGPPHPRRKPYAARASFDIATCMYYAGVDPFTKKPVQTAKELDRPQAAARPDAVLQAGELLRRAGGPVVRAGRADLIGGCEGLIPANPPKEAIEARRRQANRAVNGDEGNDHYHTVANPAKGEKPGERGLTNQGYRPGRKTARRQGKKLNRKGGPESRP